MAFCNCSRPEEAGQAHFSGFFDATSSHELAEADGFAGKMSQSRAVYSYRRSFLSWE